LNIKGKQGNYKIQTEISASGVMDSRQTHKGDVFEMIKTIVLSSISKLFNEMRESLQ